MLPPASKNVATGGPLGSNGNGVVVGSSGIPPRKGALLSAEPNPAVSPRPPPRAPLPEPRPPPRPPPRGGALFARIHTPEKSGLPSAVRGTGASRRTAPFASRGSVGSAIFGHWAAIDAEYSAIAVPAHASVLSGFIV